MRSHSRRASRFLSRTPSVMAACGMIAAIALGVLWIRSFSAFEIAFYRLAPSDARVDYHTWGCTSVRGVIAFEWTRIRRLRADAAAVSQSGFYWMRLPDQVWVPALRAVGPSRLWDSGLGFAFLAGDWSSQYPENPRKDLGVSVPVWFLIALVLIPSLLLLAQERRRWRKRTRIRQGLCRECGFDVRASPDRCPECGTTIGGAAR